jgi:hypothetical protein
MRALEPVRVEQLIVQSCLRRAERRAAQFIVAALLLCLSASFASADQMTFRAATLGADSNCGASCTRIIVAEGEINDSTPEAFLKFVALNGGNRSIKGVVFLHSPGGRVVASMQLGEMFRKAGAAVVVARVGGEGYSAARCFSACVYALMGARKRVIPPGSQVAIHRMFMFERLGGGDHEGQPLSRTYAHPAMLERLTAYARKMGVSPEIILSAERVAPDQVHVVSAKEMRRWRLAVQKF